MTGSLALVDCVARRDRGEVLELPSEVDRTSLRPGDRVQLIFEVETPQERAIERMYVRVSESRSGRYVGVLLSAPVLAPVRHHIQIGGRVDFGPEHVAMLRRIGGPL